MNEDQERLVKDYRNFRDALATVKRAVFPIGRVVKIRVSESLELFGIVHAYTSWADEIDCILEHGHPRTFYVDQCEPHDGDPPWWMQKQPQHKPAT